MVKTTTFGAFVELKKGIDGLIHISQLGKGRVKQVEDVVNRGDIVTVEVVEIDKARNRIGLKPLELPDRATTSPFAWRLSRLQPIDARERAAGRHRTAAGVRSLALGVWIGVGSRAASPAA